MQIYFHRRRKHWEGVGSFAGELGGLQGVRLAQSERIPHASQHLSPLTLWDNETYWVHFSLGDISISPLAINPVCQGYAPALGLSRYRSGSSGTAQGFPGPALPTIPGISPVFFTFPEVYSYANGFQSAKA